MKLAAPKSGASSGSATGNPKNKTALKKGRSLMDWIKLGKSGQDLTSVNGQKLQVTPEELAKHNKEDDAWMSIRGYVYNVTPYMEYHPGGIPELMRGVGTDATKLFDEAHNWVNFQSMLKVCLVGRLVSGAGGKAVAGSDSQSKASPAKSTSSSKSDPSKPRYEWTQTDKTVTLEIYTKYQAFKHHDLIIDHPSSSQLKLTLLIKDNTYIMHLDLEKDIKDDYKVSVNDGKAEVVCTKSKSGVQWTDIGKPKEQHETWGKTNDMEVEYRKCKVSAVSAVTHDTNLYTISVPQGTRMCIPLGYHVHIRTSIEDMEVTRSYTVVPKDMGDKEDESGSQFYLIVKIYGDGAVTPYIGKLKKGDSVEISTPTGDFKMSSLSERTHVVLCAAGTGITPMMGLLQNMLYINPLPNVKICLLFYNKTEKDILCRDKFDALDKKFPQFTYINILSQADDSWDGLKGRISKDHFQDHLSKPGKDCKPLVCACGPTPFTKEAIRLAGEFGCKSDMTHAFLA